MEQDKDQASLLFAFLKKNLFIISLLSISFLFIVVGLIQYFKPQNEVKIEFTKSEDSRAVAGEKSTETKIMVDVSGAVSSPGVYLLAEGARLQDALIAAGGLSQNSDREYVAKRLNLAQKLSDGAKLYIPAVDETPITGNSLSSNSNVTVNTQGEAVNINSASQAQLESLPKIGPVTAKKIIDGRPYNNTNDLVDKKAVSQKIYDEIKDLISAF